MTSLCHTCRYMREINSPRGSRFLLCRMSQEDERFAKYPPQPVIRCTGYVARSPAPRHAPAASDGDA